MTYPSLKKRQLFWQIPRNICETGVRRDLLRNKKLFGMFIFLVLVCFQQFQSKTRHLASADTDGGFIMELHTRQEGKNALEQRVSGTVSRTVVVGATADLQEGRFEELESTAVLRGDSHDTMIDSAAASLRGGSIPVETETTQTSSLAAVSHDNSRLTKPSVCTTEQLTALNTTLAKTKYWHKISLLTRCPQESWIYDFLASSTQKSFLALNVGCNKGLDAVNLARILSRDAQISPDDWKDRLGFVEKAVCGTPTAVLIPGNPPKATGKVHCIEPMPSTLQTLEKTLRAAPFTYPEHLVVKHAVFSNTSGTALFPNKTAGGEDSGLASCSGEDATGCVEVPMTTVDDYVREIDLTQQQPIDVLMIDAEGFDYEILQGSQEVLERVRYLSFEVHSGNWRHHSLIHAVNNILSDFTCYWAGNKKLWRITNCLNDELEAQYENKQWSNIACVHQREAELGLAHAMENIFERTLKDAK